MSHAGKRESKERFGCMGYFLWMVEDGFLGGFLVR